jgi:hypothetical protein
VAAFLGVALTAATLLAPGLEGVHRWLGPLQMSPLAAPWVLSALTQGRPSAVPLALVLQAVHVAQPDAGQATAFGIAAMVAAARRRVALPLAAMAALAWMRPDPLAPVPHVELILGLAWAVVGVGAPLALALLVAAPLGRLDRTGVAMALYLGAAVAVTGIGAFPVPVLGFGAAHVVGAWTALGLIARPSTSFTPGRNIA